MLDDNIYVIEFISKFVVLIDNRNRSIYILLNNNQIQNKLYHEKILKPIMVSVAIIDCRIIP